MHDPSYHIFSLKRNSAEIAEVLLDGKRYRCHIRGGRDLGLIGYSGLANINTGETCACYYVSRASHKGPYSVIGRRQELPLDAPVSVEAKAIHDRDDLDAFYVEAWKFGELVDPDEEVSVIEQAFAKVRVKPLYLERERPNCSFPIEMLIKMGDHNRATEVLNKLDYEYSVR
jgi:hypothetical protein